MTLDQGHSSFVLCSQFCQPQARMKVHRCDRAYEESTLVSCECNKCKKIKPKLSEIRISEQLSCIYSPTLHHLKIYVVLHVDDSATH